MAHTPDTSITHVEVAAISAAARRQCRRGTCLTPPTNSSLGSLSIAALGVDVLLPATTLTLALVALDEVQRDEF